MAAFTSAHNPARVRMAVLSAVSDWHRICTSSINPFFAVSLLAGSERIGSITCRSALSERTVICSRSV